MTCSLNRSARPNISFDTRISVIGTVVAAGLIQCGAEAVVVPGNEPVPIAKILRWDGSNLSDHVVIRAVAHQWLPAIAILTNSSIEIGGLYKSLVNTLSTYFNPNGTYFLYYVFAVG